MIEQSQEVIAAWVKNPTLPSLEPGMAAKD